MSPSDIIIPEERGDDALHALIFQNVVNIIVISMIRIQPNIKISSIIQDKITHSIFNACPCILRPSSKPAETSKLHLH